MKINGHKLGEREYAIWLGFIFIDIWMVKNIILVDVWGAIFELLAIFSFCSVYYNYLDRKYQMRLQDDYNVIQWVDVRIHIKRKLGIIK